MVLEVFQTDAVRFRVLVHGGDPWWADQLSARLARLPVAVAWAGDSEAFLSALASIPYLHVVVLDLANARSEAACLELVSQVRRFRDNVAILTLVPFRWKGLVPYLYCAGATQVLTSPVPPQVAEFIERRWQDRRGVV